MYLEDRHSSLEDYDWVDEATGFKCSLRRQNMGHWCGYVDVEDALTEEELLTFTDANIVHGGVTYCTPRKLGWDAAHLGDYVPQLSNGRRVWTQDAARNETAKLAAAIKRMRQKK